MKAVVIHVITRLELGGAQRNTLFTVAHLDRARFTPALITGPGGALDHEARATGVPLAYVHALGRAVHPGSDLAALRGLRDAVRGLHTALGGGPLVVHTHSSKAGILGRMAACAVDADAVVHTVHGFGFHAGQPPLVRRAFQVAERFMTPFTDAWVFVSRADMAQARALHLVPADGGALIRSGIDLAAFHPDAAARARVRAELGVTEDTPLLLTVANFKPQKDPLTGVAAFARVVERVPGAHWAFAGDGELRPRVLESVRAHGLTGRVHLLGWRDDVPALLAAADVCLLSSRHEGLPRSVVEALASGVPVAVTEAGGTREVVAAGCGYVVPVGDPDALGAAAARLLIEKPAAVRARASTVLAGFDIHGMVRAQEHLYTRLLGG